MKKGRELSAKNHVSFELINIGSFSTSFFLVCPEGSLFWGGHCMTYKDDDFDYNNLEDHIQNIDGDNYAGLTYGLTLLRPKSKPILAKPTNPSLSQVCWTVAPTSVSECNTGPMFFSRNGNVLPLGFDLS